MQVNNLKVMFHLPLIKIFIRMKDANQVSKKTNKKMQKQLSRKDIVKKWHASNIIKIFGKVMQKKLCIRYLLVFVKPLPLVNKNPFESQFNGSESKEVEFVKKSYFVS